MRISLSIWSYFRRRVLARPLLRYAKRRPDRRASKFQRQLTVRGGAEGAGPVASVACWRLPAEQARSVRHARQCAAVVRRRPLCEGADGFGCASGGIAGWTI